MTKPLALTMGEPAGVGGEIAIKAWASKEAPPFLLIDVPDRIRAMGAPVEAIASPADAIAVFDRALPVLPLQALVQATPGKPDPANGLAVIASIERAVRLCLSGDVAAVVTNPIQKSVLYAAGFKHPGHTEFLAELAGGARVEMMLAVPELRVVPVTIHLSLKDAIAQLSTDRIVEAARTTAASLSQDFGIAKPRLAIAGLNPHAGEGGAMGREEIEMVQPAIDMLRSDGIDVTGPLPPDTMFASHTRTRYDAAICLYHDQALIPIKTLDFARGVNVTLGLPFVRTSPDHGTALDIAGKGVADATSLIEALKLARVMADHRTR
ncbi:4-hydroxythreonine-4-phosphate dehydrogenase PdxA [Roseiterribacter gracilis]|uniref:4-hydroxythreonine-4-phosphate dehydrogenase n=1 Tax=Roseiterribacter gracilis TaxID=2812848 RepID=A0A8S8XDW5_9PROT|nr:4-hydroxythreonine-4-phosphate dehydrogenase [Rhodospirillales bacterium TMPK1]